MLSSRLGRLVVAAVLAFLAVATGCAGQEPPNAVTATTQAASVEQVLSAASPNLGLFGPEKPCIERRLDNDPGLRNALAAEPPGPGTSSYVNLEKIKEACTNEVTFAVTFVEVERQAHDALTPEQLECLRAGFVQLPSEDIDRFVREGLEPTDASTREHFAQLEEHCHVPPRWLSRRSPRSPRRTGCARRAA